MTSGRQVMMISKPIIPPWNDSAKNIVKNQVVNGSRYTYRIMTTPDAPPVSPNAIHDPIYPNGGRYSAGIRQNIKVLFHGLRPRGTVLYHYFFAPNRLSSSAGRVQRFTARVKTVQTICSVPTSFDGASKLLFTDLAIVLSRDTERRFLNAGVERSRIRLIRPGIEPIPPPESASRITTRRSFGIDNGPLVIFPGDYEFSLAAQTVASAAPMILRGNPDATIVFACRIKRAASEAIQRDIRRELEPLGDRVKFIIEVEDMPAFVGCADVVLLPSESLFAKMDVPLVLLEAMSQRVPLVLADVPPLDEILETGAGVGVPPTDPEALAAAVTDLLSDGAKRARLGESGERAVNDLFSAQRMAEQVEDLYDEILSEQSI